MQVDVRNFTSMVKLLLGWGKGFLHCPKQPGLRAELLGNSSAKERSLPLVQWRGTSTLGLHIHIPNVVISCGTLKMNELTYFSSSEFL